MKNLVIDLPTVYWTEIATAIIKKNHALNRRTWFLLEGTQTSWTGGTAGDLGLSDQAFLDAQTPAKQNFIMARSAMLQALAAIDAVCRSLGSAWVFDTEKVTHTLNVRGESVWKKGPGGVRPTTGNDWTHPDQANRHAIADAVIPFFGNRDASTFPAFGLSNP